MKIIIGLAGFIKVIMVVRCGGVVAEKVKMLQGANLINILIKMTKMINLAFN